MGGPPQPEEAASALAGIRRQQEQVIDAVLVPRWYWWAVAAAMVAIGAAADSHRTVVLAVVIPVAVVAIVAMTGVMIFGAYRGAQVGSALLGERGAVYIVGFVWLVVGLTLGCGFGLRAAGAPWPATIATVIGGAALASGGPWLMSRLRDVMLGNRAGNAR
jgi:hypothetical protein